MKHFNKKKNKKNKKNKNNKKNKKNKKENTMGWWKKTEKAMSKWTRGSAVTIPTETKDPHTLNVVLFKQSTLNNIADMCLPAAGGSEFQVHYRGVQLIIKKDGLDKRLVFTIPTVFFNFKQSVTSGSVNYNLDEIAELSNQYQPISAKMAQEIVSKFPVGFFEAQGFTITARELEMGSIHRHPGDFGFSSIDLDNQVEKPGVIFRNKNTMNTTAGEKIQVDSVIYIPDQNVKIVTTETRVVKVKPTEDGTGIEGTYAEAPTIAYILEDETRIVDFGLFFSLEEEETAKIERSFAIKKKWFTKEYPHIEGIFNILMDDMDYEPILKIDPKNISQYSYRATNYYGKHYGYNSKGTSNTFSHWDDGFDWEDEEYYPYNQTNQKKQSEDKTFVTRPTWRKSQTISLLRTRGVNLNKYKEITGDGSDKDIIGIVNALKKDLQYTDKEIRDFFNITGYDSTASLNIYYNWLSHQISGVSKTDEKIETEDNIVTLLAQASSSVDDLFEAIDILYDSEIAEEDILNYLNKAGYLAEETLLKYKTSKSKV
jgi:hypothetical protein